MTHSTKPKRRPKLPAPKSGRKGRQRYVASEAEHSLVWAGLVGGIQQQELADCLGINLKTFQRVFADDIKTAVVKGNARIAARLFKKAVEDGDVAALIYWTKARMGWSDRPRENEEARLEISDADYLAACKAVVAEARAKRKGEG